MFKLSSILYILSLMVYADSIYAMGPQSSNDEMNDEEKIELQVAKLRLSPSASHKPAIPMNFMPLKIILADDNKLCQKSMSNIISMIGDEVVTIANDGNQLVEVVSKYPCDIVISDGQMPNKDGPEAVKIIRETFTDLPIFIYTANTDIDFQLKCKDSGATAIWIKPTTQDVLQKALTPYRKLKDPQVCIEGRPTKEQDPIKQTSTEHDEYGVN